MSLSEQEIIRYSRHIILPEIGGRGQRRLKEAAVLLMGVGASGSAAALYLAAAGIGRLSLWDPSPLVPQDLTNAIAHCEAHLGLARAESAAGALRAINPSAEVVVIDDGTALERAVGAHHIVVASAGNWESLLGAAYAHGTAAVLCGTHGATGAVGSYRKGEPCWRCLGREHAHTLWLFPDDIEAISAAAGVVGAAAATEAIKLILGIGAPLFGRVFCYDGWQAAVREALYVRMEGCPVCST